MSSALRSTLRFACVQVLIAICLASVSACAGSSTQAPNSNYYMSLDQLMNKLRDLNGAMITRNQRNATQSPASSNVDTSSLAEEAIAGSYREFVRNVTEFSNGLEALNPPLAAVDAHKSLLSASKDLAVTDSRAAALFDASHTPEADDGALPAENEVAITAWIKACSELEGTRPPRDGVAPFDCGTAVKQDAP